MHVRLHQLNVSAKRQAGAFGHEINIKGRVNIINNLRYNGPSGAGDKFVDTRWGKEETVEELRTGRRLRSQRQGEKGKEKGGRLALRRTEKEPVHGMTFSPIS
ncbi:hypothetical protein KM043_000803 [Ampulex compressa]|nr:hypothetical protein KM043_000803 [Ampulex compressa]